MGVVTGLPLVPAASCPSVAGALASAGLGPICSGAASAVGAAAGGLGGVGVAGGVGQAASSIVGFGANTVLDAIGSWVSSGAVWLLTQIGAVLTATTSIDLGASWFTAHYETMAALAGVVVLPLLLAGIVQSVYRQNASMLVRSVLVNVPLALLLTAIAVKLVQMGLSVTDAMSAAVAHGAGLDAGNFMATVVTDLDAGSGSGTPAFVLFLGGVVVVIGAVLVWVELLIRSAAVYVAVLFLPLALASLAWPAIAHWCRRLVDTLVALVLGKFVIVSVLSLAAGALAGGSGAGGPAGGGFAAVLGGAALLLLAAFAPWALLRLLPFVEAGAVAQLDELGRRAVHQVAAPVRGLAQDAMRAAGGPAMVAAASAGRGLPGGSPHRAPGSSGSVAASESANPLAGASSAETRGVGSMSPQGADIPRWDSDAEVTAAAGKIPEALALDELERQRGRSRDPSPGLSSTSRREGNGDEDVLVPLPRQSGALFADALGRDRLGVKLVSKPLPPDGGGPPLPGAAAPDSGDG